MQFKSKTDAEIEMANLLPAGTYDFQVVSAEDTVSKKGNDMIALELIVFGDRGEKFEIKDWLLEAMAYKLKHFCYAVGLGDKYEDGSLTAYDCERRTGRVQLDVEPATGKFFAKNTVADYGEKKGSDEVPSTRKAEAKVSGMSEDELDSSSEIPF